MDEYVSYLDSISVDTQLHERTMRRLAQKTAPLRYNRHNRIIFRAAGLAACAAVVLLCAWAVPNLLGSREKPAPVNPGEVTEGGNIIMPVEPGRESESITYAGLPVDNFILSELPVDQVNVAFSRVPCCKLSDFFSYSSPDMFVIARVLEVEQWDETIDYGTRPMQTSSLQVLSLLWSRNEEGVRENISATQFLYGGCIGDENTNLLREGGVYILPLEFWNDGWYVGGSIDVLFEIDDKGLVWSHSEHEGFSRFDGKEWSVLIDAITDMTTDENFPAAITRFGRVVRNWGALAEVTVLSVALSSDQWGNEHSEYTVRMDSILYISSGILYSLDDDVSVVSYSAGYLEQGERYLMILDSSEEGPYNYDPDKAARINDDGTITALPLGSEYTYYGNLFDEFNGYTLAQMQEEALRAKQWHAAHAG